MSAIIEPIGSQARPNPKTGLAEHSEQKARAATFTFEPPDFAEFSRAKRWRLRIRRTVRGAIAIAIVLVLWELTSRYYHLELILPLPISVAESIFKVLTITAQPWLYGPNIYVHLLESFLRAMTGFVLAGIVGIPLGMLVGRLTAMREYFNPIIKGIYPIPGIAWIPLAILWFGLTNTAVVFVVAITAVFPLFFNTEAGASQISPTVLAAGRCFGARGLVLFFRVIFPATVPYIITGLRISLGASWRMIVAGEMLAAQSGVGFILNESRFLFRAVDLMTVMVLVSVVGFLTEKVIVGTIEKRTIEKWEVKVGG